MRPNYERRRNLRIVEIDSGEAGHEYKERNSTRFALSRVKVPFALALFANDKEHGRP